MWVLLVLASCGNPLPEVQPRPEQLVPVNPALFVFNVAPDTLRVEDASGAPVPFTVRHVAPALEELDVVAAEGSAFFVVLPKTDPRVPTRHGPWKVTAAAPLTRGAPTLAPAEELAYDGCTSANGWSLTSDVAAPVWEFEVTSSGAPLPTTFNSSLMVGAWGCGRSTYGWEADVVTVRVRALLADRSRGAWSNSVELEKPSLSLGRRVMRVVSETGPVVPVLGLLFACAAVAVGLVLGKRRRGSM